MGWLLLIFWIALAYLQYWDCRRLLMRKPQYGGSFFGVRPILWFWFHFFALPLSTIIYLILRALEIFGYHPVQSDEPPALTEEEQQTIIEINAILQSANAMKFRWPIYALMAVMFLVGFRGIVGGGDLSQVEWIQLGANYGPLTLSGEYWRLVTAIFLHAGFIHYFMNMYALWIFMPIVNLLAGRLMSFLIFLGSGITGSLLSVYIHPQTLSVGASGAIFGIAAANFIFVYYHKSFHRVKNRVLKSLFSFLALNFAFGFLVPAIDLSAHIGGFIFGALVSLLWGARP